MVERRDQVCRHRLRVAVSTGRTAVVRPIPDVMPTAMANWRNRQRKAPVLEESLQKSLLLPGRGLWCCKMDVHLPVEATQPFPKPGVLPASPGWRDGQPLFHMEYR